MLFNLPSSSQGTSIILTFTELKSFDTYLVTEPIKATIGTGFPLAKPPLISKSPISIPQ